MRLKLVLSLFSLVLLSACGSIGSGNVQQMGEETLGSYKVNWMIIPEMKPVPKDRLTPLLFSFYYAKPYAGAKITEEDWEREAAHLKLDLAFVKKYIHTGQVYKTRAGRLASCTYDAIEKGFCGPKLKLSVSERAKLAQKILANNSKCNWVSLDRTYNIRMANAFGAHNATLHVRADCK
ncbi:hypothetical protein [Flexibacterium corallicola]|uniref:hypothetical protein n=1 Tax=Flexibacterium corallicola TaxID=3037259 RepID=UPI00286F9C25|nr:hypothetical protein [Pseudovibrio sp. M1P-2-3]